MKAGFLVTTGVVEVREVPKPIISDSNQVLIKNKLSTICGSDTHVVWDTKPETWAKTPGYPGHESVGVVEESNDPAISIGDLVLCVPNLKFAGGFAEYQVLPSNLVIKIPADSHDESISLAQQLGTVIFGMKRFHSNLGNGTVAIMGAGSVGLFFVAVCKLAGFKNIVVSDLHEHRLEVAKQMGATHTVVAEGDAIVDLVREVDNQVVQADHFSGIVKPRVGDDRLCLPAELLVLVAKLCVSQAGGLAPVSLFAHEHALRVQGKHAGHLVHVLLESNAKLLDRTKADRERVRCIPPRFL